MVVLSMEGAPSGPHGFAAMPSLIRLLVVVGVIFGLGYGVMFALARTAGWLAQWNEMVQSEGLIAVRPRQLYIGSDERLYVPLAQRD